MIIEFGHIAAIFAMVLYAASAALSVRSFWMTDTPNTTIIDFCSRLAFYGLCGSFGTLMYAYAVSDFTVINVVENSHTLKPLLYKLTGTWGNHEGSILFWVFILSAYGYAFSILKNDLDTPHRSVILGCQSAISAFFLLFMLATSNPFQRIFPPPPDGQDLNPLLQDPGLAFHPPFLYLGYVGYALILGYAMAALLFPADAKRILSAARGWALVAWGFLTAGIALGSYWAYYELGWGGWWFWDPVENASLMPWLLGTALLHGLIVAKRGGMMHGTILLALLCFCFSLLGTFLVRSGIITSVHAFANDPGRGVFLLLIMAAISLAAFGVYAARARLLSPTLRFRLWSRESGILIHAMIMGVLCFTVFLGTLYPLFVELLDGHKMSIGTPYFNRTFVPLAVPLIVLMAIAPQLNWGQTPWRKFYIAGAGAVLIAAGFIWPSTGWVWIALAAWMGCHSLWELIRQIRLHQGWRRLPSSAIGFAFGHAGLAIAIIGMAGSVFWLAEDTVLLEPQKSAQIGQYQFTLDEISDGLHANYAFVRAKLRIEDKNGFVGYLYPEKRYYPVKSMPTTESARHVGIFGDVYTALLDFKPDKTGATLRLAIKPMVIWIWLGGIIMALAALWRGIDLLRTASTSSSNFKKQQPAMTKLLAGMCTITLLLYLAWGAPFFLIYPLNPGF